MRGGLISYIFVTVTDDSWQLEPMQHAGANASPAYQATLITPHAQRERGKVIDRGVHIYIYMFVDEKNI